VLVVMLVGLVLMGVLMLMIVLVQMGMLMPLAVRMVMLMGMGVSVRVLVGVPVVYGAVLMDVRVRVGVGVLVLMGVLMFVVAHLLCLLYHFLTGLFHKAAPCREAGGIRKRNGALFSQRLAASHDTAS